MTPLLFGEILKVDFSLQYKSSNFRMRDGTEEA